MTYYPKPQPSNQPDPKTNTKWALVLAACFVIVGGYGLTKLNTHDYTPESIDASTAAAAAAAAVDSLSADDIKKRNEDFALIRETKAFATLPAQDALNTLTEQHFDAKTRTQLAPQLAAGQVKMTKIKVWDDVAEDGDIVAVITGGMRVEIQIMNLPVTVAMPVVGGVPIQIEGIKDGGGGITLGFGDDNFSATPVLKEGEVINIQAY